MASVESGSDVGTGIAAAYKDKVKMNQLQNLLHDALISTEHVEHCCIIRRKDVSLRASSVGFTLYQDQIQMFVDAFKNPPQTREDGLYFEDRHYKCVRADKNAVYAKCDKVKMNQLQNLLHDALISTEHVEHCCIIRRKDVSLRASSVGFTLYQDQIQMFVDAFKNPPQTREDGLYFEDRHYKCVRADKNAVYAKCVKRGLVVVRTGSLLIVGTYNDNMYPSVCVEAVEKLADYFKEKGK